MSQQPLLVRSPLTDIVYIVTRYRLLPNGNVEAAKKFPVTDDELRAIGLVKVRLEDE